MEYILTHHLATDRQIPLFSLSPSDRKTTARVIAAHGLGGTKEAMLPDLFRFAQAGFTGVAIDLRLHGERLDSASRQTLLDTDFMGAMQQVVYGTADDIAYLLDQWSADTIPTGFLGVSTGGMIGHVLAIQKSPIQAMACCISSPDWLTADPTLAPPADSPLGQMLAATSPVNHPEAYPPLALLMINGDCDQTVTHLGSVLLEERLRPIYDRLGIGERLSLHLLPGMGHFYPAEMSEECVSWMQGFLPELRDPPA